MKRVSEYPMHLMQYLLSLGNNQTFSSLIMSDSFVFATFFAAVYQVYTGDDGATEFAALMDENLPEVDINSEPSYASNLDTKDKMMQIVKNMRSQFGESVTSTYVNDFFLGTAIYEALMAKTHPVDEFRLFVLKIHQDLLLNLEQTMNPNIINMKHLLNCSDAEARLIELAFFFSADPRSIIFRDALISNMKFSYDYMYAVMIEGCGLPPQECSDALSAKSLPIALGIVDFNLKTKKLNMMSEYWLVALSGTKNTFQAFAENFFEPISEKKKTFAGAIAKASPEDMKYLEAFMSRSVGSENMNILIYGSKTLDKKGFIQDLIKPLKINVVQAKLRDASTKDIPGICYLAQKYLDGKFEPHILIIDRAERALTKHRRNSWFLDMLGDDRADDELDSDELLLSNNNVSTIWIVDDPSGITDENVGRFLFHVELKGGSRADRKTEVLKIIQELGYSDELAQSMSRYYQLSIEQIKTAARGAKILDGAIDGETCIAHLVKNSQKALDRDKVEEIRDSVTKYSLDLLNLTGNMSPQRIIKALQKHPTGSLCLYGPPGTGKTQLAEYLALQLDKPLLVKSASDILDMYLGETEKNIVKMFKEAKETESILLLDEADSLLRDRSMAQRSWEVSQVNELLKRIELWDGIFICATNLFSAIDAAALRRFTFKLEFRPLTTEQRLVMLSNETGLDLNALSEADRENLLTELTLIQYLTPGDFATVKRQANLLDETLTVEEWLSRLQVESKAKLVGIERNTYNHNVEVVERI